MKMNIFFFTALLVFLFSQRVIAEPEMVFVEGGCFQMGDIFNKGDDDERPVHEVCVDDYYIGKYEVTQKEWMEVMGENPSAQQDCDDCPVENVSWKDIKKYIKKLNKKTSKKYRFPTEAEWEYAARSGGKEEQWAGLSDEILLEDYAWLQNNSDAHIHPVGKKKPNGLGIYDMSGNVSEFVWDVYDNGYYKESPKDNPKGDKHKHDRPLVYRGGSCISGQWPLRTTNRNGYKAEVKSPFCGFRLARSVQ
ncbi:MAG: formylglycine-generating enzyme family protein [Planctomycetes bacterium]|nr:formylglycine-generating enzyme family protein [Planctomycetota bacterium]